MNRPLEGVKVVDLTSYLAGPQCGRALHDWGADVIKVEGAYGDITRHVVGPNDFNQIGFDDANYGKKTISLDLRKPEGLEVLHKLIASADVFVTSYREKTLEREDLVDDERFSTMGAAFKHMPELTEELEKTFLTKTRDEWVMILTKAEVPCSGQGLSEDKKFPWPGKVSVSALNQKSSE